MGRRPQTDQPRRQPLFTHPAGRAGAGPHRRFLKCFRREVLETIELDQVATSGYSFQIEMTYRVLKAGFDVLEVPITFRERTAGKSKMSTEIVAEAMWKVPAMRVGPNRVRPLRRHVRS